MIQLSPSGKRLVWLNGGYAQADTIMISITRDDLEKLPDKPGLLSTFDLIYPNGYSVEWDLKAQLDFLNGPMGRYLGYLCEYNVIPMWKLSRLDLSGIDLRLKDLHGFDLSHSLLPKDLRACDLRRCTLNGIEARGADFTGCNLSGSILDGADLRGSTWIEAALHGVEMNHARLNGSYWRESVLKHVSMTACNMVGSTWVDCLLEDCDQADCVGQESPDTFRESEYLYDELGQSHPVYVEDNIK